MKIYTKTGDKGTTSLVGGTRVPKNDVRLEAYGTVDELNCWIGYILSFGVDDVRTKSFLNNIQNRLFDIGAILATEPDSKYLSLTLSADTVKEIEENIDNLDSLLPKHDKFILPGGSQQSCITGIARTVCRRCERTIVSMEPGTCPQQQLCVAFINRLSDYLFVLSRYFNINAGISETFWRKE